MQKTKENVHSNKIFGFIVFISLFISIDTLLFGTNSNQIMVLIGKINGFIIAAISAAYIAVKNQKLSANKIIILSLLIITLFVPYVIYQEKINSYIMRLSVIIAAFFFSEICKREQFTKYYDNVLFFLSVISLIMYALAYAAPNLINAFPNIYNVLGYDYKTVFLSSLRVNRYGGMLKNASIFRESGVYVIFLTYGLFIQLFEFKNINLKHVVIYFLSVVLTYSTAGYFSIAFLIVLFVFERVDDVFKKQNKKVIISIAILGVAFLVLFTDILNSDGYVFGKLDTESSKYSSTFARMSSVYVNIKYFLQNPLIGVGEYKIAKNFAIDSYNLFGKRASDNTNTFLANYAANGIIYGTICVIGWFNYLRKGSKNSMNASLKLLLFFLVFSGQAMWQNILFYLIMFYGYDRKLPIGDEMVRYV